MAAPEPTSPKAFQAPTGTFDVLAPASRRYERLVGLFAGLVGRAGYGLVVSPMFEEVGVFQRVGEATDVVRKEMYEFEDKGGRRLALRPEGTASVIRAFVQHRPPLPFKAWYAAPNFRYERPQAARFRQHHQLGVEAIGSADPDLDVEVIALQAALYRALGLRRVRLLVNSLGDEACAPAYAQVLRAWLETHANQLCEDHRRSYMENPKRVLDCRKPACVATTSDAPLQFDQLCEACRSHFARVADGLEALGIEFDLAPRLVRGLDYYTRTTWEFVAETLDAAQNAVGGGGRLDRLVAELGGPPTPALGFGTGVERLLLACDAEGVFGADDQDSPVEVFVVDMTGSTDVLVLTEELRATGLGTERAFDRRSLKAQFKAADRSGAKIAVVLGEGEAVRGVVGIKELRADAAQTEVPREAVVDAVRKLLR